MSFLAPGFLVVGALALVGVVLAHLFSRSRPREIALPTARFVPEGMAVAPTRARTPTDVLLLVVRCAVIVLVALAFALPVIRGPRRDLARVIAVDVSSHVAADTGARRTLLDSVRRLYREGDAVVAFDTAARRVTDVDSLFNGVASRRPGSLSVGLIAAMNAARELARTADSVELVLVSPVQSAELDSATLAIRARWPGGIRVIRTAAEAAAGTPGPVEVIGAADDPLRATIALAGGMGDASVRVVRGATGGSDSAWAAAGDRVLIVWPSAADAAIPPVRPVAGTGPREIVGAIVAGGRVIVAAFEREASPPAGRVVARWLDGVPAATEIGHGSGCIRTVAIPIPRAGDLAVQPEFGLFVRELLTPCGGRRDGAPASAESLAMLRGGEAAAASSAIAGQMDVASRLPAWLLASALALALLEHSMRRARSMRVDGAAPVAAPADRDAPSPPSRDAT